MKRLRLPVIVQKATKRTPDPKQSRREKKYQAKTGHNPRLGRQKS